MITVVWGAQPKELRLEWGAPAGGTPSVSNPTTPTQPVAVLVATAGAASWARSEW